MGKHVRFTTLALAACAAVLVGCNDLNLKNYVRESVELYGSAHLTLLDGGTAVDMNGSVSWNGVMIEDTGTKTLTVRNDGGLTLTLTGASPVAVSGSPGPFSIQTQPSSLSLDPGASTTFTLAFTPPAGDTNYSCSFVINSNDPSAGSFGFTVAARSTQWHGTQVIPRSNAIKNPQIVADPTNIFLAFQEATTGETTVVYSYQQGCNWLSHSTPALTTPFILSAQNGIVHMFRYQDTATTGVHYVKPYAGSWSDATSSSSSSADTATYFNGDFMLSGLAYMTWYDSSTGLMFNAGNDPPWVISSWAFSSTGIKTLTGGTTGRTGGLHPSIKRDAGAGVVYILYYDNVGGRLMLLSSSNNFTDVSAYNGPTVSAVEQCALLLTGTGTSLVAHAVWAGASPGRSIKYSHTTTNLSTWSTPVDVGNNWCGIALPFAVDANGKLYILHQNYGTPTTSGIMLSTSANGAPWTDLLLDGDPSLIGSTAFASNLTMAVSGTSVYAAYTTGASHANGRSVVFLKSIDAGVTW